LIVIRWSIFSFVFWINICRHLNIDIQHHEHAELYWEFKKITETTTLKILNYLCVTFLTSCGCERKVQSNPCAMQKNYARITTGNIPSCCKTTLLRVNVILYLIIIFRCNSNFEFWKKTIREQIVRWGLFDALSRCPGIELGLKPT
jgi:hypothetical protein